MKWLRWIAPTSVLVMLLASGLASAQDAKVAETLTRVREVHGGAGPWAVVGYRMGARALGELKLPRHSFSLLVVHHAPREVQYSCVADGLQAATGASPGKLNLRIEVAPVEKLHSVVEDRKTGRTLTFTIKPAFARSIKDLPWERLDDEGARVASLSDDQIFTVVEMKAPTPKK